MALDDATSFFSQGKEAFNSGNYDKAFSCFSKAADLGNAEAQCYIGICLILTLKEHYIPPMVLHY